MLCATKYAQMAKIPQMTLKTSIINKGDESLILSFFWAFDREVCSKSVVDAGSRKKRWKQL